MLNSTASPCTLLRAPGWIRPIGNPIVTRSAWLVVEHNRHLSMDDGDQTHPWSGGELIPASRCPQTTVRDSLSGAGIVGRIPCMIALEPEQADRPARRRAVRERYRVKMAGEHASEGSVDASYQRGLKGEV